MTVFITPDLQGRVAMRHVGGVPKEQVRRREQVAVELSSKGWTMRKIAAELASRGLGVITHQAVSKMLDRIDKRALAEMNEQIQLRKVKQTRVLEHILDEAMRSWEDSKKPQKTLKTKNAAG